jgi:transmembrane sensor
MKMENLEQYDEWILKFFSGELSDEEEKAFHEWISREEANRVYAAEFYKIWNLGQLKNSTGDADVEKEWLLLSKNLWGAQIPATSTASVEAEEKNRKRTPVFALWKKISVAVAVLLILVLAVVFLTDNGRKAEDAPVVQANPVNEENKGVQLRYEINNTGKTKMITLSDGSIVQLYDKSEMEYYENFAAGKRAISLAGRAYFKVARDPKRPFIVTTNMLSTTALGTEFEATAFKNENRIAVRLYEGKVVVSSPKLKTWKKDVYLAPGEEIVYLIDKDLVQVHRFLKEPEQEMAEGDPTLPFDTKGSWYMFNNQSLSQVFEQLEELYSTRIVYSKKDIANMYFIGKFKKDDSLEVILKKICLVNGLKLRLEGDQYHINK